MASWLESEVIYFLNSRIWMFSEVSRIMPLALLMKSQILLLLHKKYPMEFRGRVYYFIIKLLRVFFKWTEMLIII